jgi:hypothetical protein
MLNEITDVDGISWHEAPVPPIRHECFAQTKGNLLGAYIERCPCGAINHKIRFSERDYWMERLSRKEYKNLTGWRKWIWNHTPKTQGKP